VWFGSIASGGPLQNRLRGNVHRRPQEFGRKIGTVWPNNGPKLGVKLKLAEIFNVFQRFKNFSMNLISKVDLTLSAIVKAKPERMP
jgi:hypothetical protein